MIQLHRLVFLLVIVIFCVLPFEKVSADPPNPPIVPGSHGQGGNTGAPIDNTGILVLISGSIYAGWMLLKRKSEKNQEAKA